MTVSKTDIESINFTWFRESKESLTNDISDRNDYVAVGKSTSCKNESKRVILILNAYDDGNIKITNNYATDTRSRFHYFIGKPDNLDHLKKIIEELGFEIEKVNTNL